jgi:hypothetical protein
VAAIAAAEAIFLRMFASAAGSGILIPELKMWLLDPLLNILFRSTPRNPAGGRVTRRNFYLDRDNAR